MRLFRSFFAEEKCFLSIHSCSFTHFFLCSPRYNFCSFVDFAAAAAAAAVVVVVVVIVVVYAGMNLHMSGNNVGTWSYCISPDAVMYIEHTN